MRSSLGRYRVLAYLVGFCLLGLVLVGVPLRYGAGKPEVVAILGPIHGFLYLVYLAAVYDLARKAHFRVRQIVALVAAGLLPFLAFVVERRITAEVKQSRLRRTTDEAGGQGANQTETPGDGSSPGAQVFNRVDLQR